MKNLMISIAFLAILSGIGISVYFFRELSKDYSYHGDEPILMAETGQVGDFIGGSVGTLFALAGTFLIYLSFREQTSQNKREAFESSFFEMIRLHRDNVSELKYSKSDGIEVMSSMGRKVFREIFQEFVECYREVKKFYRTTEDILTPRYKDEIVHIINRVNPKIKLKEFALIDIAYSVVFFGMSEEGERILRYRFKPRYINSHIFELLEYLRLKPKVSENSRYQNWHYIKQLPVKLQRETIKELYDYRRTKIARRLVSQKELDYLLENNYKKYYGGHQHRLGHYFRHLFQTYKYLHYHKEINKKQKYFYAKTLRAQLSTYEQVMLFVNSISSLGMKWELKPEIEIEGSVTTSQKLEDEMAKNRLISEYHLIKNLPGERILDLRYKSYYPQINYESEE